MFQFGYIGPQLSFQRNKNCLNECMAFSSINSLDNSLPKFCTLRHKPAFKPSPDPVYSIYTTRYIEHKF